MRQKKKTTTTTTAIQFYLEMVCSYAKMIQFKDANSLNSKIKASHTIMLSTYIVFSSSLSFFQSCNALSLYKVEKVSKKKVRKFRYICLRSKTIYWKQYLKYLFYKFELRLKIITWVSFSTILTKVWSISCSLTSSLEWFSFKHLKGRMQEQLMRKQN